VKKNVYLQNIWFVPIGCILLIITFVEKTNNIYMRYNNIKTPLIVAAISAMLFASCGTTENIAYIHDAERDNATAITGKFTKGIQANDLLSIYVESETPAATVPFNQETNKIAMSDGVVMNPSSSAVSGYLVSNEGDIMFPVLGRVHVLGMTHTELADELQRRLVSEGHILDARVTVRLMNFTVSVLGDVVRPGVIQASGERLTILEALSMVGDLTIFGQRNNVTVIREEDGMRTIGEIDLTSKDIFESPYYYLHQNDVVYVEPNMKKKKTADRDPMIMTYISTGVSILSMLLSAYYYWLLTQNYRNR
jgi:polysaccharide export outer membrane protein